MKRLLISLIVVTLAAARQGHAANAAESEALRAIRGAGPSTSMSELTAIVKQSTACCSQSPAVSAALTQWLRENHPLHAGRLPTQVNQLRGFVMASLAAFPPNEELYRYVRSELLFGGHPFNLAAAAVAARGFPGKSAELLPLMEPFLGSSFEDQLVDVTTPELTYPPAHPTRARYEIIRTIHSFDHRAYRSVAALDALAASRSDPTLARLAAVAAAHIREVTPACCRKPASAGSAIAQLQLIDQRLRKPVATTSIRLQDQDGKSLRFGDLRGRPFVLTFFYSQCTNQLKCVSTVRQLQFLSAACAGDRLSDRVGIYGMTYDAHFDTPSVLQQFGRMHGLHFAPNVRLLRPLDDTGDRLRQALDLRVSYGAGSVNQHGIQLFLFDKHGRIAATLENEIWSATEVKNGLAALLAE